MFTSDRMRAWALRDSHVHLFLGNLELSELVRNPSDRLNSPLLNELQNALELNDETLFKLSITTSGFCDGAESGNEGSEVEVSPFAKDTLLGEIWARPYTLELFKSILESKAESFQMQTINILDAYFSLVFYRLIKYLRKFSDKPSILSELGEVMYLLAMKKDFKLSIGIHPWYMGHDEASLNEELELIHELWGQECSHAALGEIGLDGRCDTDFKLQEKTFTKVLDWAFAYWQDTLEIVPLSIHCVSAHNEIEPFLKDYRARYVKTLKEAKSLLNKVEVFKEKSLDPHDLIASSQLLQHEKLKDYDESAFADLGTMHFFMSSQDLALKYRALGFRLGISGHALRPQNDAKFKKLVKAVVGEKLEDAVGIIDVETDYAGSDNKTYPENELNEIALQICKWHGA